LWDYLRNKGYWNASGGQCSDQVSSMIWTWSSFLKSNSNIGESNEWLWVYVGDITTDLKLKVENCGEYLCALAFGGDDLNYDNGYKN
jgi:hypothetical protein